MTASLPAEERFKENLIGLCRLAQDTIRYVQAKGITTKLQPVMIDMAIGMIQQSQAINIIQGFIRRSRPHWEEIRQRNESFLITNLSTLFEEVSSETLAYFSELILIKDAEGKLAVQQDTRDSMWAFLGAMVKGCLRHIHERRCLQTKEDGTKGYTVSYFPEVSLRTYATAWGIHL